MLKIIIITIITCYRHVQSTETISWCLAGGQQLCCNVPTKLFFYDRIIVIILIIYRPRPIKTSFEVYVEFIHVYIYVYHYVYRK